MQKNRSIFLIGIVILLAVFVLTACKTAGTANPTTEPTAAVVASATALDGATLLQERCTVCHSLDKVTREKETSDGWTSIVDEMIGKGAKLSAEEKAILIDFLAETYKP